ncbi:XRE family transcriptional regulator [Helicobacter sp. MIT 00-7814]|uniref:helix-turn-helix domain-containing protein n=1 Tax=unclassified Helicobacter TaxID=2593540 RepID=UPI000E1F5ED8|nr:MULTISPECIES: helix-turn-helix transcriptional regulator [unclassified Helicobacter]RDU51594.1 XRE family transcriptional regulator [Helicobacter sp. MIT 99-10781]RDU52530.1 XRE family transcriptional regulator [Helicobacter sp. MIT 00-7814]
MKLNDLKQELLKDKDFKQEYEALKPAYELKRKIIKARLSSKLTQAQVARSMQVSQSVVAKFESNNGDFKFSTLQAYAKAVGLKKLVIEL